MSFLIRRNFFLFKFLLEITRKSRSNVSLFWNLADVVEAESEDKKCACGEWLVYKGYIKRSIQGVRADLGLGPIIIFWIRASSEIET